MPVCSKCKIERNIEEFSWNYDKRRKQCKYCCRKVIKAHYEKNKEDYLSRTQNRRLEIYKIVNELKNKPCMDCGKIYPPYMMDFDHREGTNKISEIGNLIRDRMVLAEILVEIEKCDIVCANCHRFRTQERLPRTVNRNKKTRRIVEELKRQPCTDCKNNFPSYVMDYDHRDSTAKLSHVAKLVHDNRSIEFVLREIQKCDLVCANCHRIRTYNRLQNSESC